MNYQLDDQILNVEIIKKNNKNTYIRLKDDATIYVTTNYFTSKNYIRNLLDNNQEFLRKALKKVNKKIESDSNFYLLGIKYEIIFSLDFRKLEIDNSNRIIYAKNNQMLDKWLINQMKEIFLKRLNYNYQLFNENIPYPKLKIRNMKTRWGVCNRSNFTVTLNSKLIRYSLEKLDYVIIHELSHFVHFNHSSAFWKIVSQYCPNYKMLRKQLNE